jgi:hypothetical protein
MRHLLLACLLLLSCLGLSSRANAAECTAEITNPYTQINAGGHYCLGANLVVNATSGSVVSITAYDVDLDCRGYSIINQSNDTTGDAVGIYMQMRRNVHVHNCHVRGAFSIGIDMTQTNSDPNQNQDVSVTDNTVSGATWIGILAYGTSIDIRNNLVYDIGGRASFAMGIRVGGSILAGQKHVYNVQGNVVRDVVSPVNYGYGIYANNAEASSFVDNKISGTTGADTWSDFGIKVAAGSKNKLTGNQISGGRPGYDVGISAPAADACYDNHIRADYKTVTCDNSLGNF